MSSLRDQMPATIQLDEDSNILNVSHFIQSHLAVLRINDDKPVYESFYLKLVSLKNRIS